MATKNEGNPLGLIILIAVIAYFAIPYLQDKEVVPVRPVVVDPDPEVTPTPTPEPKSDSAKLKNSRLIVVSESKSRSADEVDLLDDYNFWYEYLPSKGMDFLVLDPDDPSHKNDITSYDAVAGKKRITGSYVAHIKGTTFYSMIPIPKKTEELKKLIERVK